ncbi:hypothetical protein [Methanotorris formicicus]|nr:hypothetical protein [Methanotorris formicicus]
MLRKRRDKSILEIEGNYLTSEKSNIGFVRFIAIVSNCIEYLIQIWTIVL